MRRDEAGAGNCSRQSRAIDDKSTLKDYASTRFMAATNSIKRNRFLVFLFATIAAALALYLFYFLFSNRLEGPDANDNFRIPDLILWGLLAYSGVRLANAAIFDYLFRLRRGYEAPTLLRNIFTLVVFAVLFALIFSRIYTKVNLGAIFTTSAIFGVIIGLALQDTLGNFFAGISLHADRPFQVGDVIVVTSNKLTGVVESITW